jgi:uncharacterized lipoprotein YehR (DUF1307 family)
MKILKSVAAVVFIAFLAVSYTACEKEDEESCEQQDMNEVLNCGEEKNVEVCCVSGSSCTYKYNGTEYPDTNDGLSDLADALGCTYKSDADYEKQKEILINHLIELKYRASSDF